MTIHMRNLSTATAPQTQPRNFQHEAFRLGLQLYTRLSADGAAKLVERLALTPDRLPMPSRYEYLLDQADSHTQLHHGPHTLPIYSWGDGPTILGVHGWSGSGIQFGAYIEPLVAAGYRVVLYDAPAHGRAQGERTDLYEMTEVLAKVAHQVGPLHAIIAHSLGSIAAGRALVDGLDASRLVLLAPPASLSEVVNEMGQQMGLSSGALAEHRKRMETRFGGDVWQQLSLEELAPQLRQQGLVVIDSEDTDVSADQSARVYHNWPDSELMPADGLGHHRMLRAPQVVDAVTDFLTRDRVVPH